MEFEKRHETQSGLSHWVAVKGHAEPFARFCLNDLGKHVANPELVAARDLMMSAPAMRAALDAAEDMLAALVTVAGCPQAAPWLARLPTRDGTSDAYQDVRNAIDKAKGEATEAPAVQRARVIYALVIDDDLGTGVSVHATHEKRLAAIAGYVRDNWAAFNDDGQDDGEAPEMTDDAAQAIFEDSMAHVGFVRWYVTEDCEVSG